MKQLLFLLVSVFLSASFVAAEDGVRRIVRLNDRGKQLLDAEKFRPYEKGFDKTPDGFCCDNAEETKQRKGVLQHVVLDQKVAAPIVASAWSRAENVGGNSDADYSIYLDLVFNDGSTLWGQTAPFPLGTKDWNRREVVVFPEKPIKSLSFYTLFRNHSGKAWFRDLELRGVDVPEGACLFDGVSVVEKSRETSPKLLIRDVAANGDFLDTEKFPLGLDIKKNAVSPNVVEYRLESRDDADHVLTFVYTVPVERKELIWCEDPRRSSPVPPQGELSKTTSCAAGFSGRLSRFPFAAVAGPERGDAVGIDLLYPVVFRTGYNASTEELFVAADVALTKEKRTATLRFCRFVFEQKLGFRGALAEFYRMFPEQFRCRTPKQGVWMPFAKISKVEGWEDFGFMFKEGNDEAAWDDEHGILTFRYTEPTTWWMGIPKDFSRTMDVALKQVEKLIEEEKSPQAKVLFSCGMKDVDGNLVGKFLDTPWTNGIVWSMNELPGLPEPNAFATKWNRDIFERFYGPNKKADLDGEYVDSAEGYVTAQLDFAREHFSTCKRPLTFDKETRRPAIYRGLVLQEYVEKIADDVHGIGKLSMANGTPSSLCWLVPHLDVLGTETDWNHGGKWSPMSDAELLYRRALCGPKPYCFLMNTDFDKFPYELVQRFMKRSLAYGMFPGFFSADASTGHYFSRPELYNRDRPLFKKYVPLCKMIAEAGWNPITRATSDDPAVYVERFGKYLTIFNDSKEQKTVTISLENRPASLTEHVRGTSIAAKDGKFSVVLAAEDVLVVEEF